MDLFGAATWKNVVALVAGVLLWSRTRTVSSALYVLDGAMDTGFRRFHRLLAYTKWSGLGATATEAAAIVTKAARKAKTQAKAEAKAKAETAAQAANATSDTPAGKEKQKPRPHRTLPQRTAVVMGLAQMWLRGRTIVMIGDGGFVCRELFMTLAAKVVCVARCRMDVRLFDDASPKTGKPGRPAKKGARQMTLAERLKDKQTKWTVTTVAGWNRRDGQAMEVEFITGTAMWSGKGGSVPVRWVLTRAVGMKREPAAFLCTDLNRTADEILRWYAMRWAVEVTFQEARRHLGVETQRQWSDLAIRRTTPVLFGLFSLVVLWATNYADTTDAATGEEAQDPGPRFSMVPEGRTHVLRLHRRHPTRHMGRGTCQTNSVSYRFPDLASKSPNRPKSYTVRPTGRRAHGPCRMTPDNFSQSRGRLDAGKKPNGDGPVAAGAPALIPR
jgi:hypothetical protein